MNSLSTLELTIESEKRNLLKNPKNNGPKTGSNKSKRSSSKTKRSQD
jgi:hypothetical protein